MSNLFPSALSKKLTINLKNPGPNGNTLTMQGLGGGAAFAIFDALGKDNNDSFDLTALLKGDSSDVLFNELTISNTEVSITPSSKPPSGTFEIDITIFVWADQEISSSAGVKFSMPNLRGTNTVCTVSFGSGSQSMDTNTSNVTLAWPQS
jgi:hypothetical protein